MVIVNLNPNILSNDMVYIKKISHEFLDRKHKCTKHEKPVGYEIHIMLNSIGTSKQAAAFYLCHCVKCFTFPHLRLCSYYWWCFVVVPCCLLLVVFFSLCVFFSPFIIFVFVFSFIFIASIFTRSFCMWIKKMLPLSSGFSFVFNSITLTRDLPLTIIFEEGEN